MASTLDFQHKPNMTYILLKPINRTEKTNESLPRKGADVPRGWPTWPSKIPIPFYVSIWSVIVDIALLLFSVAFLAFALIVNHYNQAATVSHPVATERLQSAAKYVQSLSPLFLDIVSSTFRQGPTVFPLLFASVVGRAVHAILLWRLEKGEHIVILDTLAGSTSLTSTVTSQL
jgi:hypothetical protein